MPRKPGVWLFQGWYVTSSLGRKREKLCKEEEGEIKALAILYSRLAGMDTTQPGKETDDNPPEQKTTVEGEAKAEGETPKSRTVAYACKVFLAFCESEKSQGTYKWYKDKLGTLTKFLGEKPLEDVSLEDGLNLKASLKDWKSSSINMVFRAAKALFKFCSSSQRKWVNGYPWSEMKQLKEKGRTRLMSDDEFAVLLEHCQDGSVSGGAADFREVLTVLRKTTMRPGDVRHFRWEYVKWDEQRIVFPADVVKTRTRRVVTLTDSLIELLKERKERMKKYSRDSGLVFSSPGKIREGNKNRKIASVSNQMITASVLAKRLRAITKKAAKAGKLTLEVNGERLVPYTTRHTRITELVKAEVPINVVMEEAGHKSIETTKRYIHDTEDMVVNKVREKMNEKDKENS